ncbi:hypothetical protein HZH68_008489 [Vespula germanica]|uniref:BHLH domain-containing protein n=1 Tax=Vespula germanica TaxID=30212 RepID=A0A834JZF1_VESGE|nr:hypothetical protein HZH68_008489 [Vespula germanica]
MSRSTSTADQQLMSSWPPKYVQSTGNSRSKNFDGRRGGGGIDASKSTKGASKLRRDLINAEIANLRDLLPLPPSTRQRLSQLQLMALVCVFLRKANYFQQGDDDG